MRKRYSPKRPKVSHRPMPYEPGQWDRTGQRNKQRKRKEESNEQLFVTEI